MTTFRLLVPLFCLRIFRARLAFDPALLFVILIFRHEAILDANFPSCLFPLLLPALVVKLAFRDHVKEGLLPVTILNPVQRSYQSYACNVILSYSIALTIGS